jgi:hypothetical protein
MQQRYYDPQIGRFLSVDPVVADAAGGATFNRYWYANNNPYRFNDPDGRQPVPGAPIRQFAVTVKTQNSDGSISVQRYIVSDNGINDSSAKEAGTVVMEPQHRSANGAPATTGEKVMTRLFNFSEKEGKIVQVTSGQRTPAQNRAVDGAPNSQHLQDNAADIRIPGNTKTETADAAYKSGEFNRVNEYPDGRGVHVDLKEVGNQGRFYDWEHQHD